MTTTFTNRHIIIIEVGQKEEANARAALWDFDTGGGSTFDNANRLSANGREPATHLMVETAANAAMNTAILRADTDGKFSRLDDATLNRKSDILVTAGLLEIQTEIDLGQGGALTATEEPAIFRLAKRVTRRIVDTLKYIRGD